MSRPSQGGLGTFSDFTVINSICLCVGGGKGGDMRRPTSSGGYRTKRQAWIRSIAGLGSRLARKFFSCWRITKSQCSWGVLWSLALQLLCHDFLPLLSSPRRCRVPTRKIGKIISHFYFVSVKAIRSFEKINLKGSKDGFFLFSGLIIA